MTGIGLNWSTVGKRIVLAGLMAASLGGCGQKYLLYDQYLDTAGQARVGKSKNVFVSSVDYNNDLIVVELKAKGYSIDASKADFSIELDSDVFTGTSAYSKFILTTMTFTVKDAHTGKILFSKVGLYSKNPTNGEVQDFIRENLGVFQGVAPT